jgi:hypothetical protein
MLAASIDSGIISTIHFNPDHSKVYAAGSYGGTVCIYGDETGEEYLTLHVRHGLDALDNSCQ